MIGYCYCDFLTTKMSMLVQHYLKYHSIDITYQEKAEKKEKMTQEEYFNKFDKILQDLSQLTQKKNKDYADSTDAFANFRQIEHLTSGKVSMEQGILVRMTDKLKRLASLLEPGREVYVRGEKIEDTLNDLAVYSIIMRIIVEHRDATNKTPKSNT